MREQNPIRYGSLVGDEAEIELNNMLLEVMQDLEGDINLPDDCKLTKERIRTIYCKAKYGSEPLRKIAEYYGIPMKLVMLIEEGKAFTRYIEDLI